MTTSNTNNRSGPYNGDGVSTNFAVTFYFLLTTEILVTRLNADTTSDTLVLGTDYMVSGAGVSSGGSITLTSGAVAPTGSTITITPLPFIIQTQSYPATGTFPSLATEQGMDRLTIIDLYLLEKLNRAITLNISSSFTDISIPDPVGSTFLGWNTAGTNLQNYGAADTSLTPVSSFMATILTAINAAAARAGLGAVNIAGDTMAGNLTIPSLNGGPLAGMRNRIINGNFRINQRSNTSGSALSAGVYGHDRWKAGAGGGTYTFSQNLVDTTITVTAGSLIQVIEDKNIEGGNYMLSWSGTATARIGINGSAASGSYVASPIAITGATQGQTISIEFSTGTVGTVQLEPGTKVTPFERRMHGIELSLCQRYYEFSQACNFTSGGASGFSTNTYCQFIPFAVPKRASPTFNTADAVGAAGKVTIAHANTTTNGCGMTPEYVAANGFQIIGTSVSFTDGGLFTYSWTASAEL